MEPIGVSDRSSAYPVIFSILTPREVTWATNDNSCGLIWLKMEASGDPQACTGGRMTLIIFMIFTQPSLDKSYVEQIKI